VHHFSAAIFAILRGSADERQQEKRSLCRFNRAIPDQGPAVSGKVQVGTAGL
jgi:hypothetical protein